MTDASIKLPRDLYDKVTVLAKREDRTKRTILRRAVENYLKAEKVLKG